MITVINKAAKCDHCGYDVPINILNSVNVTLNPELRKMVLEEEIFKFKCTNCGNSIYALYPILYHDMTNKFMIYYIPESLMDNENFEFVHVYDEFNSTQKRIVNNLSTLKEEILIFENELSDTIVYATKFALTEIIKSKIKCQCLQGYFYGKDNYSDELKFIFLTGNDTIYKKIKLDVYNKLYETSYQDKKIVIPKEFVCINERWLSNVIEMVTQN